MAILAHILSYYSNLNDWNVKILQFLVNKKNTKSKTDVEMAENVQNTGTTTTTTEAKKEKKTSSSSSLKEKNVGKYLESFFVSFLDWSIAKSSTESLTKVNIVDVLSRWSLSIVYITFIVLYFVNFVF